MPTANDPTPTSSPPVMVSSTTATVASLTGDGASRGRITPSPIGGVPEPTRPSPTLLPPLPAGPSNEPRRALERVSRRERTSPGTGHEPRATRGEDERVAAGATPQGIVPRSHRPNHRYSGRRHRHRSSPARRLRRPVRRGTVPLSTSSGETGCGAVKATGQSGGGGAGPPPPPPRPRPTSRPP
jgi:hypothetical protein